jgi:hypothetical protein
VIPQHQLRAHYCLGLKKLLQETPVASVGWSKLMRLLSSGLTGVKLQSLAESPPPLPAGPAALPSVSMGQSIFGSHWRVAQSPHSWQNFLGTPATWRTIVPSFLSKFDSHNPLQVDGAEVSVIIYQLNLSHFKYYL